MDFNQMVTEFGITLAHADEILPGDMFDTRCGAGDLAFEEVLVKRFIENDEAGQEDLVELRLNTTGMSATKTLRCGRVARIIPASPLRRR